MRWFDFLAAFIFVGVTALLLGGRTRTHSLRAMNSLKQLVQGAGGRITNMEVQQFQKMNPGWDLSPEGNMRMLQLINQAAVRDQGLATVLKGVKSNDPADFDTAEQNYAISSQIRKARSYRERCKGVDDATLARAQALMEDAKSRGITLTSAEAVQQASNGASGLGRLQRLTEGTTGGSAVLFDYAL
jgi:hypothetical protein